MSIRLPLKVLHKRRKHLWPVPRLGKSQHPTSNSGAARAKKTVVADLVEGYGRYGTNVKSDANDEAPKNQSAPLSQG